MLQAQTSVRRPIQDTLGFKNLSIFARWRVFPSVLDRAVNGLGMALRELVGRL